MRGKSKIISILGALVLAMSGSWFVFAETASSPATNSSATEQKSGSGFLDGMTFDSELGPVGAPADIEDSRCC